VVEQVIKVRNLKFSYPGGIQALCGVDFDLFPSETVAVFGANGSGKTTFVLHLNGLLSGEGLVEVCGLPVRKETLPVVRRKVGMVFQDPDSQLFMPSVLEDVAFGPLNLGLDRNEALERAAYYLRLVGMEQAALRPPYQLSSGEKRRVAIAGVLAMEPEVLVLDEPTTFLDPPGQRELILLLARLPQAKVIVTHNAVFAGQLAGRAVFFEKGKITAEGNPLALAGKLDWQLNRTPQPERGDR